MPDVIEILPGDIVQVLHRLSRELPVPLIAGGLLSDKADVLAALGAGALCVSASRRACGRCEPCRNEPCRRDCRPGCRLRSRRPVALRR